MPSLEHGFKAAIQGIIGGVILWAFLESLVGTNPVIKSLIPLFHIISIFAIIEMIDNVTYWGIMYSIGYLFVVIFISGAFMTFWESELIKWILIIAVAQKIMRKFT